MSKREAEATESKNVGQLRSFGSPSIQVTLRDLWQGDGSRPSLARVCVLFRNLVVMGCAVMAVSACDKPSDFVPKKAAASAVTEPSKLDMLALRAALQPCERAMEAGSEEIAAVAVQKADLAQRVLIQNVREVCAGAIEKVRSLPLKGRLKDPCVRAVDARETVAAGALEILDAKAGALGVETLRNKIADQAAASRACADEIALAEQGGGGVSAAN